MSKSGKIIIGILTFLPFLLLILFLVNLFRIIAENIPAYGEQPHIDPRQIALMFIPMIMTVVLLSMLTLGLMIYYIIHCANNKNLTSNDRVMWILLFVFVGMIAFPVYWYIKIWKDVPTAGGDIV
jgi:hypothetical protein